MINKKFIGRKKELDLLGGELNQHRARLIVIRGRRRIGKSRLVQEFIQRIQLLC